MKSLFRPGKGNVIYKLVGEDMDKAVQQLNSLMNLNKDEERKFRRYYKEFKNKIVISIGDGNIVITLTLILWVSAISSALLDNVPFAAAMVPVIRGVSESTSASMLNPMAFTLALGCDIGGNATPIGASANVVGLAVAEKHGIKVTWKEYCKVAIPAMVLAMILINILILWVYA